MPWRSWLATPPSGRPLRSYVVLAVALIALTLLLDRLEPYFGLALLVPYLVLVVLAARWGGFGAAVFISLASIPVVDLLLLGPEDRVGVNTRLTAQFLLVLLAGLLLGWLMHGLRLARERAEAAAEAERAALQERDAVLSIIAHDLRSPLSTLKARIQLAELSLQRGSPDLAGAVRSLQAALPQVDRINRLLDDLLATGRTDGGTLAVEPAELDLAPLVGRVAERWRTAAPDHPLELRLEEPLPVMGDADRLEQVLDNLLANAVKYSPRGSPIRLSAQAADGQVRLAVADRGGGIPPDEQARLFERFYRRPEHRAGRQSGLGLGLYITRELVEAHGGRIWVESEVDRGSTFIVTLPLRAGAPDLPKTA